MNTDFYRIKRLPPYIFEEVNRLKAAARARGEDIIDFGMGNPDMATPDFIVDKLCETARDPRAHRYSASRGIKGLRKAHCAYYKRRFGVELNPDKEVIAALGSAARWRPHVKTVKQSAIVELLLDAGVRRFKCATLEELTMVLATAERRDTAVDVLLAYPLPRPLLPRLDAIARPS